MDGGACVNVYGLRTDWNTNEWSVWWLLSNASQISACIHSVFLLIDQEYATTDRRCQQDTPHLGGDNYYTAG